MQVFYQVVGLFCYPPPRAGTPIKDEDACPSVAKECQFRMFGLAYGVEGKTPNIASGKGLVWGCTRRNREKQIIFFVFCLLIGVTKRLSQPRFVSFSKSPTSNPYV